MDPSLLAAVRKGLSTTETVSSIPRHPSSIDADHDEEINYILVVNRILQTCGINNRISSLQQCSPSMFVVIIEHLFGTKLLSTTNSAPSSGNAIIRAPSSREDHTHNAYVMLKLLQGVLEIPLLDHIHPESVVDRDAATVRELIDIYRELIVFMKGEQVFSDLPQSNYKSQQRQQPTSSATTTEETTTTTIPAPSELTSTMIRKNIRTGGESSPPPSRVYNDIDDKRDEDALSSTSSSFINGTNNREDLREQKRLGKQVVSSTTSNNNNSKNVRTGVSAIPPPRRSADQQNQQQRGEDEDAEKDDFYYREQQLLQQIHMIKPQQKDLKERTTSSGATPSQKQQQQQQQQSSSTRSTTTTVPIRTTPTPRHAFVEQQQQQQQQQNANVNVRGEAEAEAGDDYSQSSYSPVDTGAADNVFDQHQQQPPQTNGVPTTTTVKSSEEQRTQQQQQQQRQREGGQVEGTNSIESPIDADRLKRQLLQLLQSTHPRSMKKNNENKKTTTIRTAKPANKQGRSKERPTAAAAAAPAASKKRPESRAPELPVEEADHPDEDEDDEVYYYDVDEEEPVGHQQQKPKGRMSLKDRAKLYHPESGARYAADPVTKGDELYIRYVQDYLDDARKHERDELQRKRAEFRNLERERKLEQIRMQRFLENEQQAYRSVIANRHANDEAMLKELYRNILRVERERVLAERAALKEYLADLKRQLRDREASVVNHYAQQIELLEEKRRQQREDRKIAERAQRLAAEKLLRDEREKRWNEIRRMRDRITSEDDARYHRQSARTQQMFNQLFNNA